MAGPVFRQRAGQVPVPVRASMRSWCELPAATGLDTVHISYTRVVSHRVYAHVASHQ